MSIPLEKRDDETLSGLGRELSTPQADTQTGRSRFPWGQVAFAVKGIATISLAVGLVLFEPLIWVPSALILAAGAKATSLRL